MKKTGIIIGTITIVIATIIVLTPKPNNKQLAVQNPQLGTKNEPALSEETGSKEEINYCYNTKMGMKIYRGVPNKFCVCLGEEVLADSCPAGVVCDSTTVNCRGKIAGLKFGYGSGTNQKEFDSLEEWEVFCQNTNMEKEVCWDNLNYTKEKK
jgi:hypothetical protein